jgi:acyl-coenzyme A synthetase/AMP-(fatty) acid ligase
MSAKPFQAKQTLWETWLQNAGREKLPWMIREADSGRSANAPELTARAQALGAAWSQDQRIEHRIIAFSLPNSIEWMAVFLGIQAAQAAALPLEAGLAPEQAEEQARQLGAGYLYQDGTLHPLAARPAKTSACCVKTTSGSTGTPKRLFCHASHLLADGRNILATMKIRPKDRQLGLIPFGHSYGLGNLVLPLILQGTPVLCARAYTATQIPAWAEEHALTVFPSVPAIFHFLAQSPSIARLEPLRLFISAGAPLKPETAAAFHQKFGKLIHNFYGSSETGGICYDRSGKAGLAGRAVGKAMENVRVKPTAKGIEVKSGAVALPGGRHLLPDLGEWNRYGELRLIGRAGSIANIGGKKVHPGELEKLLMAAKGVREAKVFVLQDKGRDYLAAAVETELEEASVRHILEAHLPEWKQPRLLLCRAKLPRTARGKLGSWEVLRNA